MADPVLGVASIVYGTHGGQLGRLHAQLQEPDSVSGDLPDAQLAEPFVEAGGEAGYLLFPRRLDDLNRDGAVRLVHVVGGHRFVTLEAGTVIETELEVVPGAGDYAVFDGAPAEGVALVRTGVIDREQLPIVESKDGESVVSDAEQLAASRLHLAGWELAVQAGRAHGRVPSQSSWAS
jgi:hypothetical protein